MDTLLDETYVGAGGTRGMRMNSKLAFGAATCLLISSSAAVMADELGCDASKPIELRKSKDTNSLLELVTVHPSDLGCRSERSYRLLLNAQGAIEQEKKS